MRFRLLALLASAFLAHPLYAGDLFRFEDAALHAVQFIDRQEGWAVGDEGVVWHTIDGGRTWERQPTGVRASLRALHFLDPYTGWVVGREELPNGVGSTGVLLFTNDGGLKWQRTVRNALPGLNHVRFLNNKIGCVAGDGTDHFPTGIFRTSDGGRSWQPVPGPPCPGWKALAFEDTENLAFAGNWSRLATLHEGNLGAADVDTLGGRSLRGLQLNGKRAVAVGQGGAVLLSDSAGLRWGYADLKLPTEVRACWDFHAVQCLDDRVWIAGRPGSALLHSRDKGRSWEVLHTGHLLPLNGIFFRDENHGWAVGEFGSILGTLDGGKTWNVQRKGGARAAVLFVHARPAGLPVDTLASLGANEGYLASAVCVGAPDPASASLARAAEAERWASAVGQAGGAGGEMLWQFPIPQHLGRADKRDLLQAWDRLHGRDQAADHLFRQLVLALRMWRPAVVITDHPDPKATGFPIESLIAQAVHEAIAAAANPETCPEQIQVLGLEPWQVQKLYGRWHTRAEAQVVLEMNEICPRLRATYRDFATPAHALLGDLSGGLPALPMERCYRLLDSKLEGAAKHQRLMEGIDLKPGGMARREMPPAEEPSAELMKSLRERRNLQVLAESPASGLVDPDQLLARLGPALAALPDDQASAAACAIANHYVRQGQWTLAREVYLLMVDRYPAHPLAADAYRWLLRYNSSSEARRRHELGQFKMVSNLGFQVSRQAAPALETRTVKLENRGGSPEAVRERRLALLGDRMETRRWNEGCLEIGKRLMAFGPLFATDPSTQFCLSAARRNLGAAKHDPKEMADVREWYKQYRDERAAGPWRDAAAAELWLANRTGPPPKPAALCRQTALRPFLDASLDESCWKDQKPILLRNAVGATLKDCPTEVWLAYDKDFLYLAARCRHPQDRYVPPVKSRPRDADLRSFDRVSLLLDLDRDYSTYFRLQIDQRGCVCEDCWGDYSWNPRWFVAVASDKTCWTVEAAIPMIELTGDKVTIGRSWAGNVTRVLPGRGVQAFALPADVQPLPEGMGIVIFAGE